MHSAINAAMADLAFCDPDVADFKERLVEFYSRQGIMVGTIDEAVSYVYDNALTQDHDIYELREGKFFILPALLAFPKDVLLSLIKERREQEQNPAGEDFRIFIANATAGAKSVHQHFLSLRNSRRKFTELKPVPDFPPYEELQEFHECKRKPAYIEQSKAAQKTQSGQRSYLCRYCSLWHNGHPPTRNGITREAMEKRYKRTWRRYKNI